MARRKKTIYQLRKKLPFGICNVSVSPLRARPDDRSEMVSQLLFGECVTIITKRKNWVKVICFLDEYIGWMDVKQLTRIDEDEFVRFQVSKMTCLEIVQAINNNHHTFPILLGSSLPEFDGLHIQMPDSKYVYNGTFCDPEKITLPNELIERIARMFLHAPYLWGGRSIFGIDCSGLTQVIYKILGINIPRDASQQVYVGENVEFVEQSQVGDLAFFINENNQVHHVGIVLENQTIIHASGKVRIDRLDHQGIYNEETRKYTHQIRIVKRLLPTLEQNSDELEQAIKEPE